MSGKEADTVNQQADARPYVHPYGYQSIEDPIGALASDIAAVCQGGKIRLFVGEAHPEVYNSRAVEDAVLVAHGRGAKIEVITGPIMLEPEHEPGTNGLLHLLGKGKVKEVYHRTARFGVGHFRLVSIDDPAYGFRYYQEYPHDPIQSISTRSCENLRGVAPGEFALRADEAVNTFKFWKDQSVRHSKAMKSADPLVLFTTPTALTKLVTAAEEQDLDFDLLTAPEILKLARAVVPDAVSPRPRRLKQFATAVAATSPIR